MQLDEIRAGVSRVAGAQSPARLWLRRVMPRVGVLAVVLFVIRTFLQDTWLYRDRHPLAGIVELLTLPVILFAVCYWGYKALRWLKRRLLWRVRRRLAITYLFVGLTPIVLLLGLGFLFAMSIAMNDMSQAVTMQVGETTRQATDNARSIAGTLAALPATADDRAVRAWLDERNKSLQATLPGVRLALWRAGAGDGETAAGLAARRPAQFVSQFDAEQTRGVGDDAEPAGAPLPEWTEEMNEWGGLTYVTSSNPEQQFAAPAVRAFARGTAQGRPAVLLLTVPVSRALVERYRESTGVAVRPYFVDWERFRYRGDIGGDAGGEGDRGEDGPRRSNVQFDAQEENEKGNANPHEVRPFFSSKVDQFGEPLGGNNSWVVMSATDWRTGKRNSRLVFTMPVSRTLLTGRILEKRHLGQENIPLRMMLKVFGIIFIVLELLALIAAVWMTRAVTGTVHKLHRATDFINRGDFSHRIRTNSRDQLGELALAFNEMSANIEGLLTERVERERLERELEIAAEVQAQLFPRSVPRLRTAEMTGECRAARGVAGDYYDYIEAVPGLVVFTLGDVSGKGVSASLVMSNLQAALRAQVTIIAERLRVAGRQAAAAVAPSGAGTTGQGIDAPCGVTGVDTHCAVSNMVAQINTQLCLSTDANRFATLFLALYDDHERLLRYTSAGHNPSILVRRDGSVERLSTGGTLVGVFDWAQFEEEQVALEAGDLLLVFSDGLSEAQNHTGEEYGEQRLAEFAAANRDRSADELRHAIYDEVDNWTGEQERGDDQTLVILKVGGGLTAEGG